MGGIGKTQMAIEYVYAHRNSYERIFWITAVDQASLLSGYQKIAMKAGLRSVLNLGPVETAEAVVTWLHQKRDWLLVIDNLDDITVITGFLPRNGPNQHTLITTRDPNSVGIPAEGLEVPLLDATDSVDLLYSLSRIDNIVNSPESLHASQIVEELGYLPLGIEQAAAYVREVAGDFATFLEDYRTIRPQLHKWVPKGPSRQYPFSVATTWSMAFNVVRKSAPQAANLLQVLSFLNPDGVLIDFLVSGAQVLDNNLREFIINPLDRAKTLIELERFSLLKWNRMTKTLVIHRLVQAVLRDEMSEGDRITIGDTIVEICDKSFPRVWNNDTRSHCRIYFGQVFTPLLNIKSTQTVKLVDIMERVGYFLREDGKYNDSAKILEKAIFLRATVRGGVDDPDRLASIHDLAEIYREQGKFTEAVKMHEEVLAKTMVILREDHPDTLASMHNLALTYEVQGKLTEAAKMNEQVLAKTMVILGEDHPDTLTSMHNLALTYHLQGKLTEAAKMLEEVLAKEKVILGEDHPNTLTSMHNLASTYNLQGKFTEAAKMNEQVLAKRKVILGEDHPDTLASMHNLASTYNLQGKFTEAAKMIEQLLAKRKVILGEDHPDTLASMDILAKMK
jgi:tetratricopeptide (TPR) repeat protein